MGKVTKFFGALFVIAGMVIGSAAVDAKSRITLKTPVEKTEETYKQLELFATVFDITRSQYVKEVSDQQLIENALNGMLSSLDPHSVYMTQKQYGDMMVQTKGSFGGLGLEVTQDAGLIKVISPIDDTPAAKAKIEAGDYITHIDGKSVAGLTLNEAVEKMRGKPGTTVTLSIRRVNQKPFDAKLTRENIQIKSVKTENKYMKDAEDIGYIRISTFSETTTDMAKKAIEDHQKKKGKELKGYIIDLRNNSGGLLDQAIGVSSLFLESGLEVVSTRGRDKKVISIDKSKGGDRTKNKPVVVLINDGSASASEIVAGALQDHKRAVLVGTRSFGKGSVQTLIPVGRDAEQGAMRITTARYYTPSGKSIQGKGITPDIVIRPAEIKELDLGKDYHESDFVNALDREDDEDADAKEVKKPVKKEPEKLPEEKKADEKEVRDYQLERGMDILRALSVYDRK